MQLGSAGHVARKRSNTPNDDNDDDEVEEAENETTTDVGRSKQTKGNTIFIMIRR
jgi:hypothetical protein